MTRGGPASARRDRRQAAVWIALLPILAAACAGGPGDPGGAVAAPAGDPYLAPVIQDPHGRTIRFAEFAGKVRVFDLWATWCGPCRVGIPHLNDLHDKYRGRGLVVVGVSVDDLPSDVAAFEREVPVRYPSGLANEQTVALFGDPGAIPTTLVVDRRGRLVRTFHGLVAPATLERIVRPLL
jgi:thiol-disulfide isomerase/thioredoxin